MIAIRLRGETWHARGTLFVNGVGVRIPEFSTRYKDKAEAERFVAEWEAAEHGRRLAKMQAEAQASDKFRITGLSLTLPDWARAIWKDAKRRAAAAGLMFDLGETDIAQLVNRAGGRCEVSGIEFGGGKVSQSYHRPFVASLDRIDGSKGYTFANCRLVICAVNVGINQWGQEIFLAVCRSVAKHNRHRGKRVSPPAQMVPTPFRNRRSSKGSNALEPERRVQQKTP